MVSDRKLAANRLNAQKSTGPRSQEGKARASLNAVKSGLFSGRDLVLPGESQVDYDQLRDALFAGVDPNDPYEFMLVERMVQARWMIKRIHLREREDYKRAARAIIEERERQYCISIPCKVKQAERSKLVAASDQRIETDWETVPAAVVFRSNGVGFSDHEQKLENQLIKLTRELRQWRAEKRKRKNEPTEEYSFEVESSTLDVRSSTVDEPEIEPQNVEGPASNVEGPAKCENEPTEAGAGFGVVDAAERPRDGQPTLMLSLGARSP